MNKYFKVLFFMFLCLFSIGFGNKAFAVETTWNPNDKASYVSLSNNNLTAKINDGITDCVRSTKYVTSGKLYCELTINSISSGSITFGVANDLFNVSSNNYSSSNQLSYCSFNGNIYPSIAAYGSSYTTGDVIGMAIDLDNKKIKFAKNGTLYNDITLPNWDKYNVYIGSSSTSMNCTATINFGDTEFKYTPPTGYAGYDNESISLNDSTMNLNVGDSQQLTATTTPAAVGVTWTSNDSSVATVDSTGKVTAISSGTATITATTADGLTATCTVTVAKEEESISLNKSTTNLTTGDSETLIATTTPAAVGVTWTSSDSSVATVDSTGKVTAVGAGTATITATTTDGSNLSASCAVIVTANNGGNTGGTTGNGASTIINIAYAKGDNTNNAGGEASIIFNGVPDTTLSVVKTASVKSVWVGDTFTYTIVVTNTGSKTAKAVVINDSAPNHIQFMPSGITTTQGTVDSSSTASNIVVNVGDIPPSGTVTITVPATVVL